MAKTDAKLPRCSYQDALAAIGLMKGVPMIDVARDDALISALMEMDRPCVLEIARLYDRNAFGYPTPEKVTALALCCGLPPVKCDRAPERAREPIPCFPVRTVGSRLVGVAWGVITTVVGATLVGWMTAEPWVHQAASELGRLLMRLRAFLYGTGR